jgi:hypothetical protein
VVLGSLGLLVVVAIGGAVWVAAFWLGAVRHAADSMDPGITASLANEGITLSAPSTTNVPITKDQAVATAVNDFPNRKPARSSAVLANVVDQPQPRYNCTCWVVSWLIGTGVPIAGGPAGRTPPPASQFQSWMRYHVAFIDAQSGTSEFAQESYFPVQPSAK